jgi:hypothetical protein
VINYRGRATFLMNPSPVAAAEKHREICTTLTFETPAIKRPSAPEPLCVWFAVIIPACPARANKGLSSGENLDAW